LRGMHKEIRENIGKRRKQVKNTYISIEKVVDNILI